MSLWTNNNNAIIYSPTKNVIQAHIRTRLLEEDIEKNENSEEPESR